MNLKILNIKSIDVHQHQKSKDRKIRKVDLSCELSFRGDLLFLGDLLLLLSLLLDLLSLDLDRLSLERERRLRGELDLREDLEPLSLLRERCLLYVALKGVRCQWFGKTRVFNSCRNSSQHI